MKELNNLRINKWVGNGEFRTWGKDYGGFQPFAVRQLHEYVEEMKYKLSKIPIGLHSDDSDNIFYINLKKSTRAIILGGCLPIGTKIITENGVKKIEDLIERVLTFDFVKHKTELKASKLIFSGKKNVIKFHTDFGILKSSPDHIWFIKRNGKIIQEKANKIRLTDKFIYTLP